MADFGAPAVQVQPYDPTQGVRTLSAILGVQQQQQAVQGQAAQVQQQQQDASQRAAVANFMSKLDVSKHVGSDGTLDLDEILTDPQLRQAAGDSFPQVMQSLVQVKQAQLGAKQQLANLNGTLRDQFSQTVGSLRTDPDVVADNQTGRIKVQQAMGNFAQSGGPDAARVANIYSQVVNHAPQGQLSDLLSTFQLQAMDPSTQSGRQAPNLVDTGATLQNVNPQAAGGAPTGPIRKGLPPGAVQVQDAYGRTFILNPQTNTVTPVGTGRIAVQTSAQPSGTAGGAGGGFAQPVAGQQQVLTDLENTRAIGDQAPTNRNINQHLLQLSQDTRTGPATQAVQKLAAAVGLPSGSRYQEVAAYLDRQAAMQARTMGVPNTNAGLAASQSAAGTTEYTPAALQEKVKFADALNSGAMAYRQGLDKAVGTGPAPDLSKYQAFRSAWAKSFDPDVYRYGDALRRGDKQEQTAIQQRLGKNGMQQLIQKSGALSQLENGVVPSG